MEGGGPGQGWWGQQRLQDRLRKDQGSALVPVAIVSGPLGSRPWLCNIPHQCPGCPVVPEGLTQASLLETLPQTLFLLPTVSLLHVPHVGHPDTHI